MDAIEKAKELKPDLIVLDLAMPEMNGIEAASVIKGMMPRVPIVLFTVYTEAVGNAVSAAGIDAVLSKPEGGWKLLECVRTLLPQLYLAVGRHGDLRFICQEDNRSRVTWLAV